MTFPRVNFHGSSDTPATYTVQFELQALKRASQRPREDGYRVAGFAPFEICEGDDVTFTVKPGAYAARFAFVELSSGRRTAFTEIPVSGVALAVEQGGAAEKPAARKKAA